MQYTTLKEYTYELHMKESTDVVAVFYHGINILSGTPKEIFNCVTPSIFVKEAKRINRPYHKMSIVEIDIDESEAQEK
ncbi:hypothetical protein CI130P2_00015 [Clostridium phage CI130P2]|nr:hypothetical protein CI130P2_00015 [Clostridium phage CI130P2]